MYHNFLSASEADHIRSIADPSMQRSTVFGADGSPTVNEIRTSSGTFLARQSDEVIKIVENRIAAWTMLPMPHQEDLQVLKYQPSQQYRAHMDVVVNNPTAEEDGQSRCATVLMYLTGEPGRRGRGCLVLGVVCCGALVIADSCHCDLHRRCGGGRRDSVPEWEVVG